MLTDAATKVCYMEVVAVQVESQRRGYVIPERAQPGVPGKGT